MSSHEIFRQKLLKLSRVREAEITGRDHHDDFTVVKFDQEDAERILRILLDTCCSQPVRTTPLLKENKHD